MFLIIWLNRSTLRQQQNSTEWGTEVRAILAEGINKTRKGHDAGDHPPITPMKLANRNDLEGDAWKLYDYITRHFIATVTHFCIKFNIHIGNIILQKCFACHQALCTYQNVFQQLSCIQVKLNFMKNPRFKFLFFITCWRIKLLFFSATTLKICWCFYIKLFCHLTTSLLSSISGDAFHLSGRVCHHTGSDLNNNTN